MTTTWLAALAGFNSGAALLLAIGLLTLWRRVGLPPDARLGGLLMLAGLSWTSWAHLPLATLGDVRTPPTSYALTLYGQSLGFYLLLLGVLDLRQTQRWRLWLPPLLLSGLAAGLAPASWRVPLAMGLGSVYALHLGWLLWRLRAARRWFRLELPIVALFGAMALCVSTLSLLTPHWVSWPDFALAYSTQIALGYALVCAILVAVPDIVEKTRDAVTSSQSPTALARVDIEAAAERVRRLLEDEAVYRDESLTLAKLAALVELSTHQLSELLNRHFGLSFNRLLRQHRVAAAQKMLREEPRASVLSVGMAVGFASQSTFYVAFRDEVGVVPGEYRRRALAAEA